MGPGIADRGSWAVVLTVANDAEATQASPGASLAGNASKSASSPPPPPQPERRKRGVFTEEDEVDAKDEGGKTIADR